MGLSRAVDEVDTSGSEDSNNNDIEEAGFILTGIFQTYTWDQLLAVYKHQGQDLTATIILIIGCGSEAPDCVVKNLANVLLAFGRTEDGMNSTGTLADSQYAHRLQEEEIISIHNVGGGIQEVHNSPYAHEGNADDEVVDLLSGDDNGVPQQRQFMTNKDGFVLISY